MLRGDGVAAARHRSGIRWLRHRGGPAEAASMRSCFGRSPYRWETAIAESNLELLQTMVRRVLDDGVSGVAGNCTAAPFRRCKAPSRRGRARPAPRVVVTTTPSNIDLNSPSMSASRSAGSEIHLDAGKSGLTGPLLSACVSALARVVLSGSRGKAV